MKPISELNLKKEKLQKQLEEVREEIDTALKRTLLACENDSFGKGCGMAAKIGEKTYIQTWWYESPHGCMGGDIWHPDEGRWKCSHCGKLNRLHDKPDIEKLSHLFKNRVNYHPYSFGPEYSNPKGKDFKVEIF